MSETGVPCRRGARVTPTAFRHPRARLRRVACRPAAAATFAPALSARWLGAPGRRRDDSQAREAAEPLAPDVRQRRVLLVDDDAALRTLYRFNLEVSGLEVAEAADGETALRLLEGELPDVVLLDVMMPGLDGWTVAERLALEPRTRALPVIFITARAEDEARTRGLGLGAAGYLTKPFNPVSLADEIEKILGPTGPDGRAKR